VAEVLQLEHVRTVQPGRPRQARLEGERRRRVVLAARPTTAGLGARLVDQREQLGARHVDHGAGRGASRQAHHQEGREERSRERAPKTVGHAAA